MLQPSKAQARQLLASTPWGAPVGERGKSSARETPTESKVKGKSELRASLINFVLGLRSAGKPLLQDLLKRISRAHVRCAEDARKGGS